MLETLYEAIVNQWAPALITVFVGAAIAAKLVPMWQEKSNHERLLEQRKVEICEGISDIFARYLINWRRLIAISKMERNQGNLTKDEMERRNRYVNNRDKNRDDLYALFNQSRLYFPEEFSNQVCDFLNFDEGLSIKTIDELPDIGVWEKWESKIISSMKESIRRKK